MGDCPKCSSSGDPNLKRVSRLAQDFYERLIRAEDEAVDRYYFASDGCLVLKFIPGENAYTVGRYNVRVPFVMGAKLHRLSQTRQTVDYATWRSTEGGSTTTLPCVFCSVADDPLATRRMPGTFYIKNHHYYCPILVVPDKRRPHCTARTGNVAQFFYQSTVVTEAEVPALADVKSDFVLNAVGNMSFHSVGGLFPKLVEEQLLKPLRLITDKKRSKTQMEKKLQLMINKGLIERAVSNTAKYVTTGGTLVATNDGTGQQQRANEILSKGYVDNAKRYRDMPVANDFHALCAPFECYKLVTSNVTTFEHRTFQADDVGFYDPCFTSDGENVGRTVSLALGTVVSHATVDYAVLWEFFRDHSRAVARRGGGADECECLMINFGDVMNQAKRHPYDFAELSVALKAEFGLVEVLRHGRLLQISAVSNVVFKRVGDAYYTAAEVRRNGLRPAELFGLVSLIVPFPNHNGAAKNTYVTGTAKHVAQFLPPARVPHSVATRTWSLVYPQRTVARWDFPLYATHCMVGIMCVDGLNQEDAIVVKRSSIERGMFQTIRYGNYRVTYDDCGGGGGRIVRCTEPGSLLRRGTIIFKVAAASVSTFNTELSVATCGCDAYEIVWVDSNSRILHDVLVAEGGGSVRVVTADLRHLAVGDKILSCSGQKGVVARLLNEEDLPFFEADGFCGVPDLFVHPSMLKRQTCSAFLEGVNRDASSTRRDPSFPFPHLEGCFLPDAPSIVAALLKRGEARFTCRPIDGKTGQRYRDEASVLELTYQILPQHCAEEKCYATSETTAKRIDPLTGQYMRGRAHFGAMGFGVMEQDAMLGHGALKTLEELDFVRADDANIGGIRFGKSMRRFLDETRLMRYGMSVTRIPHFVPD